MNAYTDEQERNIRVMRLVQDWLKSGLITQAQRDQMAPELQVGLRRTNVFLRVTMFVFGFLILQAFTGLLAIGFMAGEGAAAVLCALTAGLSYFIANLLVTRYNLYRFGVEEAAAVASVAFAAASAALFTGQIISGSDNVVRAVLVAGCAASFAIYLRFGYVYAALVSMVFLAVIPFEPGDSDMLHRLGSIAVLITIFAVVRSFRREAGREFPGDTYAIIEAAAWVGIYLLTNLKLSSWVSHPDELGVFYWATYVFTWILPVIGLWLAILDRHRLMLDASIVMAIVTLMTNKSYLGAPRQPYDPIAFGVLLIFLAVGLKRWLANGEDGSRHGFVAERLLDSEKQRLSMVGTVSVLHQGPVATHTHAEPAAPPIGGGGRSGGAGATGSF